AKEAARFAEKLVTEAKKGTVASRRRLSMLTNKEALALLGHAQKMKDRKGGYTRVIKLGLRMSDGARIAIVELVG
ncbi:MAG: 50S ribosomal protein L17, partial [Candidatus Wildermuthbacteria bacterium]|nr:50S ribosomal protein L17 [Candidatus Wildermuthbacteria bacterium]